MATPQWLETKGGPTNYVFNLKKNLENLKNIVIIASPHLNKESRFAFAIRILKTLIIQQPDIIHIHGRLNYIIPAVIYKFLMLKLNLKIIFTFHTQPIWRGYLDGENSPKTSYRLINGILGSFLLKFCSFRVSVCKSIVDNINNYTYLKVKDFKIINSGADDITVEEDEGKNLCQKYAINNRKNFIISTVGVFSWDWKVAGHILLIQALVKVKLIYPEVKLLIAGDGRYGLLLKKIVNDLRLESNVEFLGNIPSTAGILSISNIYVHMGLNEGFPLSLVEAMIQKKPIIAVNQGGIPEVISHRINGLLVNANSSDLASAIFEVIQNRELADELGSNARNKAILEYTWAEITKQYIKLYED